MVDAQLGSRLCSTACETEVVIVRASGGSLDLRCGGQPMVTADQRSDGDRRSSAEGAGGGTKVGKRYVDEALGLEVLCTKSGDGSLTVDGRPMTLRLPKPLPSSD